MMKRILLTSASLEKNTHSTTPPFRLAHYAWRTAPVLVLLLAFFLRTAALEITPPGPRLDEITVFMQSDRIRAGSRPLYEPVLDEELLFHYTLAGAVSLMGRHLIIGRWLAGAFGMLALATLYPLARRLGGRRVALLALALMAVGFWPVMYSRFAIRLTNLLPFVTSSVYLFWRGLERPAGQERRAAVDLTMAGMSLGISVHTYAFGRSAPALFLAFVAYLFVANRQTLRKYAIPIAVAVLIPTLVDAHLLLYLAARPGTAYRLSQVSAPLDALRHGDPGLILKYTWRALTMAVWKGDPEWLYNFSERPVFDPITGALFYVGLAVCIAGWKTRWRGALLTWLAVGLVPIILTWPPASFSHSFAAQPIFYLLAAIGMDYAIRSTPYAIRHMYSVFRIAYHPLGSSATLTVVISVALVALNLGLTVRDYFFAWPVQPEVRAEYQASLTDLARYLEAHADLSPAVAGAAWVDTWNPYNAYGFSLIYRRADRPVAWYNPANALAWPPGSGPMAVALPRIDRTIPTLATELSQRFFDDAQLVYDEKLPGGQRVFKLYQARGRQALDDHLLTLGAPFITTPQRTQVITAPVNLDNRFKLLGYEIVPSALKPGQKLRVITYWETQRSFLDNLIAFTHLIGPDGQLYAQADQLDVFTDSLYPGLAFAQLHHLRLPPDAPPGQYHVQVGIYQRGSLQHLPILVNGQSIADAVWLSDVTVNEP